MADRIRRIVDLDHAPTLAIELAMAFHPVAKEYGLRIEGIEDDVNEWNDLWLKVARRILNGGPTPDDHHASEGER